MGNHKRGAKRISACEKSKNPDKTVGVSVVCLAKPVMQRLCIFLLLRKALAAVHRTVVSRLERNFCFRTAAGALGCEHFARRSASISSGVTALFASLRFVHETLFAVELLFASSKDEFASAILAHHGLVFEHFFPSLWLILPLDGLAPPPLFGKAPNFSLPGVYERSPNGPRFRAGNPATEQ